MSNKTKTALRVLAETIGTIVVAGSAIALVKHLFK